jgi:phosphocarrier protein
MQYLIDAYRKATGNEPVGVEQISNGTYRTIDNLLSERRGLDIECKPHTGTNTPDYEAFVDVVRLKDSYDITIAIRCPAAKKIAKKEIIFSREQPGLDGVEAKLKGMTFGGIHTDYIPAKTYEELREGLKQYVSAHHDPKLHAAINKILNQEHVTVRQLKTTHKNEPIGDSSHGYVRSVQLKNPLGMHARPSALFTKIAASFDCDVIVKYEDNEVSGKSILSLMALGVPQTKSIIIRTKGEDAELCLNRLVELVQAGFHEK